METLRRDSTLGSATRLQHKGAYIVLHDSRGLPYDIPHKGKSKPLPQQGGRPAANFRQTI